MMVGNTNVTVEHLKVQFEVIVTYIVCSAWFGVWHLMCDIESYQP
jgi:hypothetical protein